jgi:hypothetical protein
LKRLFDSLGARFWKELLKAFQKTRKKGGGSNAIATKNGGDD